MTNYQKLIYIFLVIIVIVGIVTIYSIETEHNKAIEQFEQDYDTFFKISYILEEKYIDVDLDELYKKLEIPKEYKPVQEGLENFIEKEELEPVMTYLNTELAKGNKKDDKLLIEKGQSILQKVLLYINLYLYQMWDSSVLDFDEQQYMNAKEEKYIKYLENTEKLYYVLGKVEEVLNMKTFFQNDVSNIVYETNRYENITFYINSSFNRVYEYNLELITADDHFSYDNSLTTRPNFFRQIDNAYKELGSWFGVEYFNDFDYILNFKPFIVLKEYQNNDMEIPDVSMFLDGSAAIRDDRISLFKDDIVYYYR